MGNFSQLPCFIKTSCQKVQHETVPVQWYVPIKILLKWLLDWIVGCLIYRLSLADCADWMKHDNALVSYLRLVLVIRSFHILRSGVLRTQKLISPLLRTRATKVLYFKPRVGHDVGLIALPAARNSTLLISTFHLYFNIIIFWILSAVFPSFCPTNKIGHPAHRHC